MPTRQFNIQNYRDLLVWQKSHRFTLQIYRFSETFPSHEAFGLASQMRRAAIGIPAALAQGFRQRTRPECQRLIESVQASVLELHYYLILAEDLGYGSTQELIKSLEQINRLSAVYSKAMLASAK